MRGLAKDPDARYGSATELVEALRRAYVAAGLVEDEQTGTHATASRDVRGARSSGVTWAYGLVLAGALVVGVTLVVTLGDSSTGDAFEFDASVPTLAAPPDAGLAPAHDAGRGAIVVTAPPDASRTRSSAVQRDAGIALEEEDAGIASMSAFEREEAAKDHVRVARERLEAGDVNGAAAALERARLYDPENGDLSGLSARIRAARGLPEPAVP
jgi:hypothetical protein